MAIKNCDLPAMPLTGDAYEDLNGTAYHEGRYEDGMGFTKREKLAAMAMQGLLSNVPAIDIQNGMADLIASASWIMADALLKELDND